MVDKTEKQRTEDVLYSLNALFNKHRNDGLNAIVKDATENGYTERRYCITCDSDTLDIGNVCPICMEAFESVSVFVPMNDEACDVLHDLYSLFNEHRNDGLNAVVKDATENGYTERKYCITCDSDTPDIGNVCPICMKAFESVSVTPPPSWEELDWEEINRHLNIMGRRMRIKGK